MRTAHPSGPRPGRRTPTLIAVVLIALIAAHAGLAGILIAHWRWSLTAVATAAAAKLLLLAAYRFRRRRTEPGRGAVS